MAPDGKADSSALATAPHGDAYDPYNPGLPEIVRNPYPVYEELRRNEPVHRSARLKMWLLTRHADVTSVLRDSRFSAGPARLATFFTNFTPEQRQSVATLSASLGRWTLFKDAPEHTRLRALVAKPFTSSASAPLAPKIEALTAELLGAVEGKKQFDVIETIAYPLPVLVIAELLGLPAADRNLLKKWSDILANFIARVGRSIDSAVAADTAVREMEEYLLEVLRDRRARPKDDLLSQLAAAQLEGGRLSDAEVASTAAMLLFGGHETTTNLIGNGILSFARNDEQWQLLAARPELAGNAVEEVLRYDAPVQFIGRIAKDPVEIGGRLVLPGDLVLNMLASANRDAAVFADPDEFRIGRQNAAKHLTFGQGIHFCLGAPLARMEGATAFAAMAKRFPRLRVANEASLRWLTAVGFRGVESLEVRVD